MTVANDVLSHVRLKLNVECPPLEGCWVEGFECARANLDEGTNPYGADSLEYEQWEQGWWSGFYEEKPLYGVSEITEITSEAELTLVQTAPAANELPTSRKTFKIWIGRVAKVAAAIAVTVAVIELVDLAA